jgi:hypothetical protein
MKRAVATTALAGLSLSIMVAGLASVRAPEVQPAISVPSTDFSPMREDSVESWPAPRAPFDETVITPIESAGAPMFP